MTIRSLTHREGVRAALVVGDEEVNLVHDTKVYRFHPNMASRPVSALGGGRGDRFLKSPGIEADAIVAAFVVGESGAVVALETSAVLATIDNHGMKRYANRFRGLVSAMRRVKVLHARSEDLLPSLSSKSYEVVYFDPMFATTIHAGRGLDLVRIFGSTSTPQPESIFEAQRVAR